MYYNYLLLVGYCFIASEFVQIYSKVELTNIKCTSLDESFSNFEYCYIKSVNRSYKYFSMKCNLHKIPITRVKVSFALLKRFNGYKPFLYNLTIDACKFLTARNKNAVINYFYGLLEPYSNMNHSCPYDHDLIWDKVSIDKMNSHFSEILPFPEGDYAAYLGWYAYGILRAEVMIYWNLS